MSYIVFVSDVKGTEDRLNGVILSGRVDTKEVPVGGLDLKIDASTITFPGAPGSYLTLDAVIAAITAQYGSAIAKRRNTPNAPAQSSGPDGKLHAQMVIQFQKDAGFTILKTGTSNPVFGLSTTDDMVSGGKVPAAKILGFTQGTTAGNLATIIEL